MTFPKPVSCVVAAFCLLLLPSLYTESGMASPKKKDVKKTKEQEIKRKNKKDQRKKPKTTDSWPVAAGLRAGLIATPLPALGLSVQSRYLPAWGGEISWENGSVAPDPSTFYSVEESSGWSLNKLKMEGTRLYMGGRWYFLDRTWLGFGLFQKNLTVSIDFSYSGSSTTAGSTFQVTGSLLSRGISLSLASGYYPFPSGLLEINWIGIDWPLYSEMIFEGGNDSLSVSVNESFFDGQEQTRQLISGLKNYPLPFFMVAGFSYIFQP